MTRVFALRIEEQMASGDIARLGAPVVANLLISLIERAIYECLVWETGELERYRETFRWTFARLLLAQAP